MDGIIKAQQHAELPIPISMNHTEDVTDSVGKITKLIPTGDGLDYEGRVYNTAKHPGVIHMMENGLINRISIEADDPLFDKVENKIIVKEFKLMGAGFVKYAGIPQASASIAEALEQNIENEEEEVEDMSEDNKELLDKLAIAEAKAAEFEKMKLAEAEKMKLAEEAKTKKLEETITALQSDVKKLQENKLSGNITGTPSKSDEDVFQIVERLDRTTSSNSFILEGKGSKDASFYPANPAKFY